MHLLCLSFKSACLDNSSQSIWFSEELQPSARTLARLHAIANSIFWEVTKTSLPFSMRRSCHEVLELEQEKLRACRATRGLEGIHRTVDRLDGSHRPYGRDLENPMVPNRPFLQNREQEHHGRDRRRPHILSCRHGHRRQTRSAQLRQGLLPMGHETRARPLQPGGRSAHPCL